MGIRDSFYRDRETLERSAGTELFGKIYNLCKWRIMGNTLRFVSHAVPVGQLMVFLRSSPAGRSLPLSMVREIFLLVVCKTVSCGRAWNGGYPLGAIMTQLMDMVVVVVVGRVDVDQDRGLRGHWLES